MADLSGLDKRALKGKQKQASNTRSTGESWTPNLVAAEELQHVLVAGGRGCGKQPGEALSSHGRCWDVRI